jgi:hypothetical protein
MPNSPAVWIVLIACVAVVVLLIVWKGRGATFTRGNLNVKVNGAPPPGEHVSVGKGLRAEDGQLGNITGVKLKGPRDATLPLDVEVGSDAHFVRTTVKDLTGIDMSATDEPEKLK